MYVLGGLQMCLLAYGTMEHGSNINEFNFILMDTTNFLLMDGTDFLTMTP